MTLPTLLTGLVDDAAIFPPGEADLGEALEAWTQRRGEWYADLVGSFVITDSRLGELARLATASAQPGRAAPPVSIVITSGAGAIAPALGVAARHDLDVRAIEVALRDLDDLPGNARRVAAAVDAARAESLLADEVAVFVELPATDVSAAWLAAADEVAAGEARLKFRTGGTVPESFPSAAALTGWIDAALDRETPFKCTAGLHQALRHRNPETGFEHHGFLNVLLATLALFDGASGAEATTILEQQRLDRLDVDLDELSRARRWFTSFGSCSITEPLDSLLAHRLLEEPHERHLG